MMAIPMLDAPANTFRKAFDTGSGIYSRIMQPILAREQEARQAEEFKKQMLFKQLIADREQANFAERMGLMRQNAARAGVNDDLRRQELQFRINQLQRESDPMAKVNELKAIMGAFRGNKPSREAPTEELGQGMGLFSPEGLQGSKEDSANMPEEGGIDMELVKKNPALRGWFKQNFGVDPLQESKESAYTSTARDALDRVRLRKEFGENSPEAKKLDEIEQLAKQRAADLHTVRGRQFQGLKPGDIEIRDPNTDQLIGFRKQTTPQQKTEAKNKSLFNTLYPLIYKGGSPYSSFGAAKKLAEDANNYSKDPAARNRIIGLMISDKAMGNTTVSEAARFGAGKTNQTYNRFAETLKAENVHKTLKKLIKDNIIPPAANLEAGARWQKILNEAEKKADVGIPATRDYYFEPERQFAYEDQRKEQPTTESETVIVIDPNGKKFETPAANAEHMPAGWKRG